MGQISSTVPSVAERAHELGIAGGEDPVPDPLRPEVLDDLGDLLAAHVAALLADVDRHAQARLARGLHHRLSCV